MKVLFFTTICSILFFNSAAQNKNLLSSKYNETELHKLIIPKEKWKPFPKIENREEWAKADKELLELILNEANKYINYDWPYIPASKSLLYETTGIRSHYQDISYAKRSVLRLMIMAEIYENKGRFIEQIVDGVWSICEESWWGSPAHLPTGEKYKGLVDVSEPFVDLYAAETATVLAWADYFIGAKFDSISPQIRKRIYYETNKRIFKPLMTKHHYWMSSSNDRRPNNWNPWICSNWLNTLLLLETDDDKRTKAVAKILTVVDEYLNPYPQDGGCDEGPGYWKAAASSVFDNVAMLNLATNNAFDFIFEDKKVRNMASFIYKAQISEKYFLNFADTDPQPFIPASVVFRFGKSIKDKKMMEFGAYFYNRDITRFHKGQYFRGFFELFSHTEIESTTKSAPLPKDVWFPDLEVMLARDNDGSSDGYFIAAKGGHNNESHNHNDIGNFIVYYDGLPVLIDVGRGLYTKKNFGAQRYDIWYNRSDYHNVPTINGKTQLPGKEHKAGNVSYEKNRSVSQLSLDISSTYPKEAGVNSWIRTIKLLRGEKVEITDKFNLKLAEDIKFHFMTCRPASVSKTGEISIKYDEKSEGVNVLKLKYDAKIMEPLIEKIKLKTKEDKVIEKKWEGEIYRINLNVMQPQKNGVYKFIIVLL